jgi:hypothetical protein
MAAAWRLLACQRANWQNFSIFRQLHSLHLPYSLVFTLRSWEEVIPKLGRFPLPPYFSFSSGSQSLYLGAPSNIISLDNEGAFATPFQSRAAGSGD